MQRKFKGGKNTKLNKYLCVYVFRNVVNSFIFARFSPHDFIWWKAILPISSELHFFIRARDEWSECGTAGDRSRFRDEVTQNSSTAQAASNQTSSNSLVANISRAGSQWNYNKFWFLTEFVRFFLHFYIFIFLQTSVPAQGALQIKLPSGASVSTNRLRHSHVKSSIPLCHNAIYLILFISAAGGWKSQAGFLWEFQFS